jgi:Cu/Ag efflux pump CusA
MIVGLRVVRTTPLDVFPEFAPPLVEIQTEAPGLSTAEVESLITAPIENALNGTAQLKTLRSKSVLGLSSVVLIFQQDTDLMRSRRPGRLRHSSETCCSCDSSSSRIGGS